MGGAGPHRRYPASPDSWPDLDAVLRQVRAKSVLLPGQKRDFVRLLLSAFGRREELEMIFAFNDLPGELVNWNQENK
jgi:hypothetical protein